MKRFLYFLSFSLFATNAFSNYVTPGTGVKWNLDDLVAHSAGIVTATGTGEYNVNDTVIISLRDTFYINTNATVKFGASTLITINGTLTVNPPTGAIFTAQNILTGFSGVRIDVSNTTVVRKLTLEYASSFRIADCQITVDSCIFRYNTASATLGSSAITLFRANPVVTNSQFLNNYRGAISGGANINNAPKIIGCLFQGNNTMNLNVPQINLGATSSGNDTVKIFNNQILRASTNSGGIGFLPIGDVYAVVSGNIIKNNRYGLTFNGGSNIHALISYNQVDSNNTQNDPNLGGSGISFTGGTATSHQNSIVTGNLFRWNLWGITIPPGSRAQPNLGNLNNADTSDDGKNWFIGNTNVATPNIELYNNSVDPVFAQNNYWGTNDTSTVEARIFHQADNAALGYVNYLPFLTQAALPAELAGFTGTLNKRDVLLSWQTLSEINTHHFIIERSNDGRTFYSIGQVSTLNSTSPVKKYSFTDYNMTNGNKAIFYRLRVTDIDSRFRYSQVIAVYLDNTALVQGIKVYPSIITHSQLLRSEIFSTKQQKLLINFLNSEGRQILQLSKVVNAGINKLSLVPGSALPAGTLYVNFTGEGFQETLRIVKQ